MLFSEIYGAYYQCVAEILKIAVKRPVTSEDIRKITKKYAFAESLFVIESAFKSGRWPLLKPDGTTPLKNIPSMPLSQLEKMWLKAILNDRRIKLFSPHVTELEDVEPLFTQEDYYIFDSYNDGDPYEDETYIQNFKIILDSVKRRQPLKIGQRNKNGLLIETCVIPERLEYSEKDDKFRLISSGFRFDSIINLNKILYCEKIYQNFPKRRSKLLQNHCELQLELLDERNALERVMLHFSHFEKEAVKIDEQKYRVKIIYDKSDETELLIRVLQFGAKVKVIAPDDFIERIKERLTAQMKFLSEI